jgi:hypothetical protein
MPEEQPTPAFRGEAASQLWVAVTASWKLTVPQLKLLEAACRCWDDYEGARVILSSEGEYLTGQGGKIYQHPAQIAQRRALDQFKSLMGQLNLKDDEASDSAHPEWYGQTPEGHRARNRAVLRRWKNHTPLAMVEGE